MVEASIHLILLHTFIWDIKMFLSIGVLSQGHMGAPIYRYTSQVGPRFVKSGSLVEWKWCHYVMVEADIHLRPLQASILDIYKVFEPLVCCLTGIWVLLIVVFTVTVFWDHCLLACLFGGIVYQQPQALQYTLSTTNPPLLGPYTHCGRWWLALWVNCQMATLHL